MGLQLNAASLVGARCQLTGPRVSPRHWVTGLLYPGHRFVLGTFGFVGVAVFGFMYIRGQMLPVWQLLVRMEIVSNWHEVSPIAGSGRSVSTL